MARNAIESEFRTSKMADGSHFAKIYKQNKNSVLIYNDQKYDRKWISDIQNGRRQPFYQNSQKKVAYRSEMARNAIESEFRTSKMSTGGHFIKKNKKNKNSVLI